MVRLVFGKKRASMSDLMDSPIRLTLSMNEALWLKEAIRNAGFGIESPIRDALLGHLSDVMDDAAREHMEKLSS